MLRVDWNRLLVVQLCILLSIVLAVVGWTALRSVSKTALMFALAAVLAFALAPLVERLQLRHVPRVLAVLGVYVIVALILAILFGALGRPFLVQATLLAERWPLYAASVQEQLLNLDSWLANIGLGGTLATVQNEASRYVGGVGATLLGDLLGILTHFATSVVDTLLVLVVSFYFLLDAPRLRAALYRAVPVDHHSKLRFGEVNLGRVLGGYIRGQLIMGALLGVVVTIGMTALGIPYALVLGGLAAVLELVPMLGPILSALPALAVALFLPFPTVIYVLVFFIVVQQLEANVLAPRITGHAVGLHPLGAIFALLAGLELGGIIGALFAVPVVGFLWVVVSTLYTRTMNVEASAPPAEAVVPRPVPADPR
jgi:predicted PurR-regulated permease PerM